MRAIINKYRGQSKDGYVFPIMDDTKSLKYKTRDFLLKSFRQDLNIWLKIVGKELGLNFDVYAYVFRHTAISAAIDGGLPVSYVVNLAGTSLEMIEKHYYNGDNSDNSTKLMKVFDGMGNR